MLSISEFSIQPIAVNADSGNVIKDHKSSNVINLNHVFQKTVKERVSNYQQQLAEFKNVCIISSQRFQELSYSESGCLSTISLTGKIN